MYLVVRVLNKISKDGIQDIVWIERNTCVLPCRVKGGLLAVVGLSVIGVLVVTLFLSGIADGKLAHLVVCASLDRLASTTQTRMGLNSSKQRCNGNSG